MATESPSLRQEGSFELRLLDGFELVVAGEPVALPTSCQRLLAFLALQEKPVQRSYVAGTLWTDSPEQRAHANLRSALWRVRRFGPLVRTTGSRLLLDPRVALDVRTADELALRALVDPRPETLDLGLLVTTGDLLPDWYDDWVDFARERHRQLRLRTLDAIAERLADRGHLQLALAAALAAVASEPLRESAHRAVIRVHLAEGNAGEAIRQYRLYRRLLGDRLGLAPSAQIQGLIAALDRNGSVTPG
jgi:DNA-binding SARP family transcriptional activator